MQRIAALWNKGLVGKVIVGTVSLLVACCVLGIIVGPRQPRQQASVPAVQAATAAPQATEAPAATAGPTNTPKPTDAPTTAPETAEVRYVRIARAGATIPIVRPNLPKGEWTADIIDQGNGSEVTLTMPVSVGLSKEQTVRQAKRHLSQVVKALFDSDPALVRATAIGTVPDGSAGSELPAVSIFVLRSSYARWDGTAEGLGEWRISPRYK